MKLKKAILLGLVLAGCGLAGADAGEWMDLFDGNSRAGWVQRNGTARFSVRDGTVVGQTAGGSPNSFLCTEREFGDFELEFEVRVDERLNSGVQIRSSIKDGWLSRGRVYGPQVEIEAGGEKGGEAGYLYGEATGRGWLTPRNRRAPHKKFKDGEWNHFRVVARGARIQTWINGDPIEDLVDGETYESHPRGFIGLQVHSILWGQGPYEVAWRHIRIRVD